MVGTARAIVSSPEDYHIKNDKEKDALRYAGFKFKFSNCQNLIIKHQESSLFFALYARE